MSELLILIEGKVAGRVRAARGGRLSLDYEAASRTSAEGHSLSVSMPLATIAYPQKAVLPYLWNLLPENPNVLQRWAQQFHVSAANPFKLLGHVGEDVPGAAQFITPDGAEEIQKARKPTVEWMTVDELAERLRQLRADVTAVPSGRHRQDEPARSTGKNGLLLREQDKSRGVPGGRAPTTHIIKPCMPGFDALVENEHLPGRKISGGRSSRHRADRHADSPCQLST